MSSDPFQIAASSSTGLHPSPYSNYAQNFTPKDLKSLFKFCEYLFYNSPHIYAALRKFGEYPITTITYDTENLALKQKHEFVLEKVLKVRSLLVQYTLDKYVYGNTLISMYQPFMRYLSCPNCKILSHIKSLEYKYDAAKVSFQYKCPECKKSVTATKTYITDKKQPLPRRIVFIRWDPKLIDIDYNAITGESDYYYTLPPKLRSQILKGNPSIINTLPLGFLDAAKNSDKFLFAKGAIYHMKVGGPAGISPEWGLPPLLSVMTRFNHVEILRKSNEAIALDHMVPFRVLHPAQATGGADPIVQMSMTKWADSMKANVKKWREDPLHIMYSPIPLGSTQMGGQGRALLTLGEVQESEKSIVAALGVPIEFLYGGLTGAGMSATLRMIENQLETHIQDLLDVLQWMDDSCAKFLGWERLDVGMTPFKMVDDDTSKATVQNIWMQSTIQGKPLISDSTILELYDLDPEKEQAKIKQETLNGIRARITIERETKKLENSLMVQVQAEMAQQGSGAQYDTKSITDQAQQIAEQLSGLDEGMRRSQLNAMKSQDIVMYSVVTEMLQQQNNVQTQQAKSQVGV